MSRQVLSACVRASPLPPSRRRPAFDRTIERQFNDDRRKRYTCQRVVLRHCALLVIIVGNTCFVLTILEDSGAEIMAKWRIKELTTQADGSFDDFNWISRRRKKKTFGISFGHVNRWSLYRRLPAAMWRPTEDSPMRRWSDCGMGVPLKRCGREPCRFRRCFFAISFSFIYLAPVNDAVRTRIERHLVLFAVRHIFVCANGFQQ